MNVGVDDFVCVFLHIISVIFFYQKATIPFIELSCIAGDYKTSDGKDLGKVRFEALKDREIITFGRDQRNKFPFEEKEVSRFHC